VALATGPALAAQRPTATELDEWRLRALLGAPHSAFAAWFERGPLAWAHPDDLEVLLDLAGRAEQLPQVRAAVERSLAAVEAASERDLLEGLLVQLLEHLGELDAALAVGRSRLAALREEVDYAPPAPSGERAWLADPVPPAVARLPHLELSAGEPAAALEVLAEVRGAAEGWRLETLELRRERNGWAVEAALRLAPPQPMLAVLEAVLEGDGGAAQGRLRQALPPVAGLDVALPLGRPDLELDPEQTARWWVELARELDGDSGAATAAANPAGHWPLAAAVLEVESAAAQGSAALLALVARPGVPPTAADDLRARLALECLGRGGADLQPALGTLRESTHPEWELVAAALAGRGEALVRLAARAGEAADERERERWLGFLRSLDSGPALQLLLDLSEVPGPARSGALAVLRRVPPRRVLRERPFDFTPWERIGDPRSPLPWEREETGASPQRLVAARGG
jgi:hypothetical protein